MAVFPIDPVSEIVEGIKTDDFEVTTAPTAEAVSNQLD
jgi:hypothetical protein